VRVQYMHRKMFKKVNKFKSISLHGVHAQLHMDMSKMISENMCKCIRVNRLDDRGIVLWASQS